ncbi:rCG43757, isoform CRA_a [Rattus norvegicus]|uniref:RCG43757, isoform CRA_a n=1 Tax=Rattus norvegicus TaxID=10116 RepID=A6MGQ2_RAT|nr:rCG43757, isoform CRA_a [Rattus norvegicus]
MQRAPSHSLTQRDARCTVLPRRSRPTNPRSGRVLGARLPAGQTARL